MRYAGRGQAWRSPLFLDEPPSTGLDPQSRSNLWDHIRGLPAWLASFSVI